MNLAPKPEQIEANNKAREAIYREQSKMTSKDFNALEEPLRDAVEAAMDEPIKAFEIAIDERDEKIEDLEGQVEDLESKVEGLKEEIEDLKGQLYEHEAKGCNG